MDASELKEILKQHKLWIETNGRQGERADLEGANLQGANLQGANLEGANLQGANLTGAELNGAILWGAILWGANLACANLACANLTGANLKGASLSYANLYDADLTGADLTGANLHGVDLTGADLTGANLTGAILPDISWIIPGCLAQLNEIKDNIYLYKEGKLVMVNFPQDSIGFFIQDNPEEKTFDILVEDRIMRNIPDWVKYSGMSKIKD
jgi:Pentapeptide repeats (8 copies)